MLLYILFALLPPSGFCMQIKIFALDISSFIPEFCPDCTFYIADYSGANFHYPQLLMPVILCQFSGLNKKPDLTTLVTIRKIRYTSAETLVLSIIWEAAAQIFSHPDSSWSNYLYREFYSPTRADYSIVLLSAHNSTRSSENLAKQIHGTVSDGRGVPSMVMWINARAVRNISNVCTDRMCTDIPLFVCEGDKRDVELVYLRSALKPTPCQGLHSSIPWYAAGKECVSAIGCTNGSGGIPPGVLMVEALLPSNEGIYPSRFDIVLFNRPASSLYIIMPRDEQRVSRGSNVYITAFQPDMWYTIVSFAVLVSCVFVAWNYGRNHGYTCETVSRVIFVILMTLLGQVNLSASRFRSSMKLLVALFLLLALIIATLYTCALSSDFTVREVSQLSIAGIEDLAGYKVYIVLEDKYHDLILSYRVSSTQDSSCWDDMLSFCFKRTEKLDQCGFIHQKTIFCKNNPEIRDAAKLLNISQNVKVISTAEIPETVAHENNKFALVTSQLNFVPTWEKLRGTMKQTQTSSKYLHKLDSADSMFKPMDGVMFPLRLRRSQLWVRRKIRALGESGIADMWSSVRNWNATVRNTKMAKNWKELVRAPVPISATKSWLSSVIMGCACALLLNFAAFCMERMFA